MINPAPGSRTVTPEELMFKSTLLAITLATAAFAVPITVVESNDFPALAGPNFTLAPGVNTISGTLSGCPNCAPGDFQDNFSVTLPSGLSLTVASFVSTYSAGQGVTPAAGCATAVGCFTAGNFSGISASILDSGTFDATITSPYSTSSVIEFPGSANYTYSFTVTQSTLPGSGVPEPGTWALLSLGLGALAFRRRL